MFKFLTIILIIVTALHINAKGECYFGFIAGVNISSIAGENTSQITSKIGINGGILADWPIDQKSIIETGILFMEKGAADVFDAKHNIDFRYIEIPVSLKYQFNPAVSASAGGYIAFLRSAQEYFPFTRGGNDLTAYMASSEGGIRLGATLQLKNGLGLYLNYDRGMTNIYKTEVLLLSTFNTNNTLSLSILYMLHSNKPKP